MSHKVDGELRVFGSVDDVVIHIRDTGWGANLLFNTGGEFGEYDFDADLKLVHGVPLGLRVAINGTLLLGRKIDLYGEGVAGNLELGACAGDIVNGGDVAYTSWIRLALYSPDCQNPNRFSGTATFANVDGEIGVEGANVDGLIHVTGYLNEMIPIIYHTCQPEEAGHLLPNGRIWVEGDLLFSQGIYVTGDVRGKIQVDGDIVDGGSIWTGGDLTGDIDVGGEITSTGSVTIDGNAAGDIAIGGDLSGIIDIAGDGAGDIEVDGSVTSDGDVQIGGDADGDIEVHGNVSGDIDIGGDADGDIEVHGNLVGNTTVDGKLKTRGRILIDGLCDGAITIGEETESLSLIRATGGLGSSGSITVNDGEGNYDAYGAIHIGPPTGPYQGLASVTFDGSIMIQDGTSGGGDLEGTISVVGCHATDDDLDICICGDNNGTVTITQVNCENQVDWSCITGCE